MIGHIMEWDVLQWSVEYLNIKGILQIIHVIVVMVWQVPTLKLQYRSNWTPSDEV
jgi:hypothetical protein